MHAATCMFILFWLLTLGSVSIVYCNHSFMMISTRCVGKQAKMQSNAVGATRPDMIKLANIHFHESEFTDGVLDGDYSTSMILRNPSWDFAKRRAQSVTRESGRSGQNAGNEHGWNGWWPPHAMYRWYEAFWYSGRSRVDPPMAGETGVTSIFSWCFGWFQAECVNLPRLSAAPRRGSETYFQPGQYKPNLDAVRPKLELEAQDL